MGLWASKWTILSTIANTIFGVLRHILAPHALRHHPRPDQAGGPDEADPHRVRHC